MKIEKHKTYGGSLMLEKSGWSADECSCLFILKLEFSLQFWSNVKLLLLYYLNHEKCPIVNWYYSFNIIENSLKIVKYLKIFSIVLFKCMKNVFQLIRCHHFYG